MSNATSASFLRRKGARAQRATRANELLQLVGLEPASFAHRFPHQLSGGQRQRVGWHGACCGAEILLMDEPFGALDPLTRAEMQDMLRDLLDAREDHRSAGDPRSG